MNNFWIPKQASYALLIGLAVIVSSALRLFAAFQAGLTQGFGPQATIPIMGRLAYRSYSLRGELAEAGLLLLVGVGLLIYAGWSIRRSKTKPPM